MFIDNEITRTPNGLTNRPVGDIFNSLRMPDPTRYHAYYEDFDRYAAGEWNITEAGVATQVLDNENGGRLLVTNAAADNDRSVQFKDGESFLFETGAPCFYRTLVQVNLHTQSDSFFGLVIETATDPVGTAPTDGVFFRIDDGDALIDFVATKNSTAVSSLAIATAVDAVDLELAFFWDGIDRIWAAVNGAAVASITPGVSLPDDEELAPMFTIQNGEAVAKTLSVDYIFAAMER